MRQQPKVGTGVIVIKDSQVLMGKRKGAHGAGSWCFPGGHLKFQETIEACARREVMEETGIQIHNIHVATFTNDISKEEEYHYITLFLVADYVSGEPKVMEPEYCEEWDWFEWEKLPQPLFYLCRIC